MEFLKQTYLRINKFDPNRIKKVYFINTLNREDCKNVMEDSFGFKDHSLYFKSIISRKIQRTFLDLNGENNIYFDRKDLRDYGKFNDVKIKFKF